MVTNILLIDLSSIAHPLFHVSASNPDPNATSIGTVARVRALASGQRHVAVCCDSGKSFRREIDPSYKANRPPSDATLQHQIALAIDVLKADGFPVWAVPGFEADDLIASATVHFATFQYSEPVKGNLEQGITVGRPFERSVTVASADKDLLQLISDRVTVHKLTDGTQWTAETVKEKLGIAPNQMRDYLCLVGDASDNIKGAKNIGAKTAAALLTRYGTIEDMFAALDSHGTQFTAATATNLREFQTRLDQVRALVSLRTDVVLPFEEVFKERVPTDVAVFEGDEMADEREPMTEAAEPVKAAPLPFVPADPMEAMRAEAARLTSAPWQPVSPSHPEQGLVVRTPEILPPPSQHFEMQLEPRSLTQAIDLAKHMHASKLFSAYGTPQAVLSVIMAGRELGMQSMASLRAFHIIESRPYMSADLIRALVLKSGHAEYFRCTERTATQATFLTKRKGDPEVSLTFTVAEGRAAWPKDDAAFAKSGWGRNPADMCVARASAKLARLVYADVVFNMYTPEEIE